METRSKIFAVLGGLWFGVFMGIAVSKYDIILGIWVGMITFMIVVMFSILLDLSK